MQSTYQVVQSVKNQLTEYWNLKNVKNVLVTYLPHKHIFLISKNLKKENFVIQI